MPVSCRQPQLRVFKSLKPQLCHENMSYWASHSFGNCKNDFSLLVRGRVDTSRYLQELTTWSLLCASQWDLVIINQKTKNKSKRQTMQLLSYKNLSRNLASRVAERLFISCLFWLSWKCWQLWKLNIRPCHLSFSSPVFLIRRRANILNSKMQ